MSRKFFKFSPSLTRDFILLYRLSLVGLLFAGCLFIKFSIDQEKQKIEEKIFLVSDQIEKSISYNVDYLGYQLHYATRQIKETNAFLDKRKMEKILSSFVGGINNQMDLSITWNAFSWVDKSDMLTVDGAGGIIRNPVDLSSRDYLKITSKISDKLVFGKPVKGALSGRSIIPVGMGVFSDDHKYLGTLVFGLDVERILTKLERLIGNETFSFVVVRGRDISFTSNKISDENLSIAKQVISEYGKDESVSEIKKVISSQGLFSKQSGFICFQNIRDSSLGILVFHDKEKSYEQIFSLFLKQSFFILLIIFLCVILFQKIYQKIVKPVSKLSKLALRISKKDFLFTIEKPGARELSDLYHTLNLVKSSFQKEEELIKELHITTQELILANESKDRILSSISHDVKNHIFGIHGLAMMVLNGKNKSEICTSEDLQIVEKISDQSEELMEFVKDLLDVDQLESGEFNLGKIKKCDVGFLIDNVILLNSTLAIANQIRLRSEIENDLPKFSCDPRRIKQILTNLITNAVKYSKPEGEVWITAKHLQKTNQLYIEIADQGFGMDEEEIKKYLAGNGGEIDKSEIAKVKTIDSYGIGMPIVFRLVSLHHGKIEVESKKGVGTKVKLYFDLNDETNDHQESDKMASEEKPLLKKPHKNKSILLVEDNPVNIKVITRLLENDGYRVLHVENGQEALEILDKENFDLIIMDGEMPIMDGYNAARAIREGSIFKNFQHYKTIPIIALMSSADEKTITRTIDSGMNDHLEKSISKTKLLDAVERHLIPRE